MLRIHAVVIAVLLGCCLSTSSQAQKRDQQPALESPRLSALEQQLKSGLAGALDAFWTVITKNGAPLVESIPGDKRDVLVTFLWRGDTHTENVVLVDGPAADDYVNNQLSRLNGTDLWYRSYRIRNDARFYYSFLVNDPLTFVFGQAERRRMPKPDPLSKHLITIPKDEDDPNSEQETGSALELRGAPPQLWTIRQPGVPAGAIDLFRVKSVPLGNHRRVWVYTPPGYTSTSGPYGVLVLFFGWDYTHVIPAPTILDNLYAAKKIPPMVAVFVDSFSGWAGYRELQKMNEDLPSFVARELMPWIHDHYNITSDSAHAIIGGLSAGGRAAAFVALRHPEIFGNVLSQSGAFQNVLNPGLPWPRDFNDPEASNGENYGEYLTQAFAAAPKLPLRFYLNAGFYDRASFPKGPSVLLSNRHLRDVLQAKGYPFRYSEFPGDHSELYWRGTLADALIYLTANH